MRQILGGRGVRQCIIVDCRPQALPSTVHLAAVRGLPELLHMPCANMKPSVSFRVSCVRVVVARSRAGPARTGPGPGRTDPAGPDRTGRRRADAARDLVYSVRDVDSFHFCKKSIVRAVENVVNNNLKNYLYSSICIEIINND